MPSRAVVRKKARREARRRRQEAQPPFSIASEAVLPVADEGHVTTVLPATDVPATRPVSRARRVATDDTAVAARKRAREPGDAVQRQEQDVSDTEAVAAREDLSLLSHKERKKLAARRRLEKEISRVNARAAAVAMSASADASATSKPDDTASSPAEIAPKLRHDPRFTHGTFWRTRKERRARTLFLGGVPASYTTERVEELVSTVLDASDEAQRYLDESQKTSATAVEEVSMLPLGLRATVRNMYLVLASVPLAHCVAARLDGHAVEGRQLRCNFAADKYQREEAIRRREGGRTANRGVWPHTQRY